MGLQLALRNRGYTYLRGSGNYVNLTLAAVKDFQRANRVNPSGIGRHGLGWLGLLTPAVLA